jgi:hypothetical protein
VRPSNPTNSSTRQSYSNAQKKAFAVPLTERETNYTDRNRSPIDSSLNNRQQGPSGRLSSRENMINEKPSGYKL